MLIFNKNGGPYLDNLKKILLSSTVEFLNLIINSWNMYRRQDNHDTVCSYWDMGENEIFNNGGPDMPIQQKNKGAIFI